MKFLFTRPPIAYLAVYLLIIPIFSFFYMLIQSLSFTDAIYFSVITITTLGYGDITPNGTFMKLLVSIEAISGIAIFGIFLNSVAVKIQSDTKELINNQYSGIKNNINYQLHKAFEKPMQNIIRTLFSDGEKIYVYYGSNLVIARDSRKLILLPNHKPYLKDQLDLKKHDIVFILNSYIKTIDKIYTDFKSITNSYQTLIEPNILKFIIELEDSCLNTIERLNRLKDKNNINLLDIYEDIWSLQSKLQSTQKVMLGIATKVETRDEHRKSI